MRLLCIRLTQGEVKLPKFKVDPLFLILIVYLPSFDLSLRHTDTLSISFESPGNF